MSIDTPASHLDGSARTLVDAVQRLAQARSMPEIQSVVRTVARELTGADGATFVLRDDPYCHYVDEDAISPLWKGQRFLQTACISGWTMRHRQAAVIEDIYEDDRIPHDAYRPTFVHSLVMVPIRTADPVGAIGNYWADRHRPSDEQVMLLAALADSTAVAMENVRVYGELEERVTQRTAELQARTEQLEETNRSIRALFEEVTAQAAELRTRSDHHLSVLHELAHEVRTPLAAARGLLELALAVGVPQESRVRGDLQNAHDSIDEALRTVSAQLDRARLEAGALRVSLAAVELDAVLGELRGMFRALVRSDAVTLVFEPAGPGLAVHTDRVLLGHVLRNLISNALKFTDAGEVRVSACPAEAGWVELRVSDTGIGIAAEDQARIFEQWQQVGGAQSQRPEGSGLGLTLVRRIVERLGGRLALRSEPGAGSTFSVLLPAAEGLS